MIKTTSINTMLTPVGQVATAESILGKTTEIQTRWSPGSLAAAIMSASTVALCIVITPTKVVGFTDASGGDDLTTLLGTPPFIEGTIVKSDIADSKSRTVFVDGIDIGSTIISTIPDHEGAVEDPVLLGLLSPVRPSYTALSLANKLETLIIDDGKVPFVVINQFDETAYFRACPDESIANGLFSLIVAAPGFDVVAAFDQINITPGASVPGYGWE